MSENIVILRSVYGKVGNKYYLNPSPNPKTGRLPNHVKSVDSNGDMILSENDKNSGNIFIPATEVITVSDGTVFDLDDPYQKAVWECIEHSSWIAPERNAKDPRTGALLIDGDKLKYGKADLYIERPGKLSEAKNERRYKIVEAQSHVIQDSIEGLVTKAKVLGKRMEGAPIADVKDFLFMQAEKHPEKIIELYTGTSMSLRILLADGLDKHVIFIKNKLYYYGDDVILGASTDGVVNFLSEIKNKRVLEMIKKDIYPDLESQETPKVKK